MKYLIIIGVLTALTGSVRAQSIFDNRGTPAYGSLRVQIVGDTALVIRTRDKKSVMVRGLNMGACTATAAEVSKSPDVEFAECFQ